MSFTPNRIVLVSHGRYDEAPNGATALYPGMLATKDSSGNLIPHNIEGGGGNPLQVVIENALIGKDITQALPASQDCNPYYFPAPGDVFLMLLQNGQNVTQNDALMSAGDGTLMKAAEDRLYQILAPSSNVTNTAAETVFDNGSYTMAAGTLAVGTVIRIRGKAVVSAQNAANTHQIQIEFGSGHTVLLDSGARALAATQFVSFDISVTIRTAGASGTYIATGSGITNPGGTNTLLSSSVASTAVDTTVGQLIRVTTTANFASTGNVDALQEFSVSLQRTDGEEIVYAKESIDNSAGAGSSPVSAFNSAAFIRVVCP